MATMDHSDIRGLVTALHRYVAGLPLSSIGEHRLDAHVEGSRIPHIVFARRVSSRRGSLACEIPDKAGEFSSHSGANLVQRQATRVQAPVALAEAQLRPPSDLTQGSRLTFVAENEPRLRQNGGGHDV
jgi:hypothetical protein